jgi:hypothetical protein
MKHITVTVNIESGDIPVEVDITEKEYKALAAAIEEDENYESEYEFGENPKLKKVYAKIMEAALDAAAEGAEEIPLPELGKVDFDTARAHIAANYKIWAEYSGVDLDEEEN